MNTAAPCLDCHPDRRCERHAREHAAEDAVRIKALQLKAAVKIAATKETGLEWEEPSPRVRSGLEGRLGPKVDRLMQVPGEWAILWRYGSPTAANGAQKSLQNKPLRPGTWEFTCRVTKDPKGSVLYARYIGPDS